MQLSLPVALATLVIAAHASVVKRATEGVHLSNCYIDAALGPVPYSAIIYYADDGASQSGQAGDSCQIKAPGTGGFQNWEGAAFSCKFSSGATFSGDLNDAASGFSLGQYAGWGYNGADWNCYRDNGRQMFNVGNRRCMSIYYCLKA